MLLIAAQKIRAWSYRPEVASMFSLAWRIIKLVFASCLVSLFSLKFLSLDFCLAELLPWYFSYCVCRILIYVAGVVVSAALAFFYRKTYYFFGEAFFLAAAHVGIILALYTISHSIVVLLFFIAFIVFAVLFCIEHSVPDNQAEQTNEKEPLVKVHHLVPVIAYFLLASFGLSSTSSYDYSYEPLPQEYEMLYCAQPSGATDANTLARTAQVCGKRFSEKQLKTFLIHNSATSANHKQQTNVVLTQQQSTKGGFDRRIYYVTTLP